MLGTASLKKGKCQLDTVMALAVTLRFLLRTPECCALEPKDLELLTVSVEICVLMCKITAFWGTLWWVIGI